MTDRALIIISGDIERARASKWVAQAPLGTRVEYKRPKRTLPQNDRFWAMLTDIAAKGTINGQRFTPDQWKTIFMHAIGREVRFLPSLDGQTFVPWGNSSSDLSVSEMSNLMEFMTAWATEQGITLNDPKEAA